MNQPSVSSGLLEFLLKTYPDRLPRRELSAFELGRLVGHQDVVEKLTQLHEKEVRSHVRT